MCVRGGYPASCRVSSAGCRKRNDRVKPASGSPSTAGQARFRETRPAVPARRHTMTACVGPWRRAATFLPQAAVPSTRSLKPLRNSKTTCCSTPAAAASLPVQGRRRWTPASWTARNAGPSIRQAAAFAVAARGRYAGQSLGPAGRAVIDELMAAGGSGGVVAVDRDGALALPFSTAGMYRGYVRDGIAIHTAIYDEPYRSE